MYTSYLPLSAKYYEYQVIIIISESKIDKIKNNPEYYFRGCIVYMRDSISAQASSKPRPFSEENTINGSCFSICNVSRTIFLCLSHFPFGILSALVATTITGIL